VPEGPRHLLFQTLSEVLKPGSSLLLRVGLQDPIQHLVHLVSVVGGRPAQDVPSKVRLTHLLDQAREGLLKGLPQAPSCASLVANSTPERPRSLSQRINRRQPSLVSPKATRKPENLPLAVFAKEARRKALGRADR
jgi:hypothetical protein